MAMGFAPRSDVLSAKSRRSDAGRVLSVDGTKGGARSNTPTVRVSLRGRTLDHGHNRGEIHGQTRR